MSKGDWVTLNLSVKESTKQRWVNHTEESDKYDSVTQLVRISLENQIAHDEGMYTEIATEISENLDVNVEGVETEVKSINENLETVELMLEDIRAQLEPTEEDDLLQEIYKYIPQVESVDEAKDIDISGFSTEKLAKEGFRAAIASELGIKEGKVGVTLRSIKSDFDIEAVEIGGRVRYVEVTR